jgi:hypothetical protein
MTRTAKPATQIKNLINQHLRKGNLLGENIWGAFEVPTYDTFTLIIVTPPNNLQKWATVQVYHPGFGKWQALLHTYEHDRNAAHLRGTPSQVHTKEALVAELQDHPCDGVLHRLYSVPVPEIRDYQAEQEAYIAAALRGELAETSEEL